MAEARGQFDLTGWDEQPYDEYPTGKLTRATVTQALSGDIEGTGKVEWLMCYREDGTADFVGMQVIEGSVAGRLGVFVSTTVGSFDGQLARGTWTIVSGSGRGDLTGIEGEGEFKAKHGPTAEFKFTYELG